MKAAKKNCFCRKGVKIQSRPWTQRSKLKWLPWNVRHFLKHSYLIDHPNHVRPSKSINYLLRSPVFECWIWFPIKSLSKDVKVNVKVSFLYFTFPSNIVYMGGEFKISNDQKWHIVFSESRNYDYCLWQMILRQNICFYNHNQLTKWSLRLVGTDWKRPF